MKKAMIWGASGGIGKMILATLSEQGWFTVVVARDTSELGDIANYSIDARFEEPTQVGQSVSLAAQEIDEINLWIYAAGDILSKKIEEMSLSEWQQIIDANLTGPFLALKYRLPLLAEDAHVMFIGAISERLRLPGLSAYASSKAGLEAFADVFRKEHRKKKVSIIRPGAVATPLWDKVPMRLPEKSASPEKVAQEIIKAYIGEHRGKLDLV